MGLHYQCVLHLEQVESEVEQRLIWMCLFNFLSVSTALKVASKQSKTLWHTPCTAFA